MTLAAKAFERLAALADQAIANNPNLAIYRMDMGLPIRGPQPIPAGAMRVAPGSDAVVWKISPEHSGEL